MNPGAALLRALLATTLLAACSTPPYPRGSLEALYPQPPRPVLRDIDGPERRLRIAEMPGPGATPLLFVHGSPGDWQAWARYLDAPALAGYGRRIAVDRPGYGGSGAGQVMPDLRAQAALLAQLIPDGPPAVVVGHSLGGPLVAWMALDHPEKLCGGVLVAGSLAADLEAPRWYNRVAETGLVQRLLPAELRWSNLEILSLQTELRKLDREWPRLRRPLVAVQGEQDQLVDPRTADYLEQRVPAAWLRVQRIPQQGHFVLWEQPETVLAAIRSLPCGSAAPPP